MIQVREETLGKWNTLYIIVGKWGQGEVNQL